MFTAAALVAAAMLSTAGPASAFGKRCGSCNQTDGTVRQDRGGPIRNLIGGVADRVRDRQEARQAARGCQSQADAFPAPPPVETAPGPVIYYALPSGGVYCPNGRCQPK
jgi:hypothetical protein